MYREQNYIFSFTFVYKSKTACLIKHLLKKKEKEKKKTSTHKPSVHFFWILKTFHHLSYGLGFILLQWHYLSCNNGNSCMYEVKSMALLWGRGWDSFDFHF